MISPEVLALVEQTTTASGVPLRITDPATLAAVAALLRTRTDRPKAAGAESHIGRDGGARHG